MNNITNTEIIVTIDGIAVAKGRPRIARRGFAYTPAKTRKYEAHGRLAAQLAMGDQPPLDVPVKLTAIIELPVPNSWSGKRKAAALAGDIRPTSRPDLDNYLKAALDAINEIVVRDDSLIVEIAATKTYSTNPRLVLTVAPLFAARAT